MYIANCPFNKIKILSEATTGLEKSFRLMYSNTRLRIRETLPFKISTLQWMQNYTFYVLICMQTTGTQKLLAYNYSIDMYRTVDTFTN